MMTPLERFVTARAELDALPGVAAVDLLTSDERTGRKALDIVVEPGYERVPPRVLRVLAEQDLGIYDVSSRGNPTHHVVVAI